MRDTITKLEKIGFSNYEAKVFMALYEGYAMSASDIAKEAKIPRPSVYEILRNFAKRGICNEVDTPSKQLYEIIDSNYIKGKLELGYKIQFDTNIRNLKECFTSIEPLYKSKKPKQYRTDVELIRGYNLSKEMKFLELVKNSSRGILLMNRFRGNISTTLDRETRDFFKRGGVFKSIYEKSTKFRIKINDEWKNVTKSDLIKICEEFTKQGEKIKFLNEVPQIMAVFDESVVYISLWDEHTPAIENSDIIIKNKRFASFITSLFNLYWDKANTLEELKKQLNL